MHRIMGLRDLWRNTSLAQQGPYATINHDAGFSLIMNAEPGNLYGMQNMQQARVVDSWLLGGLVCVVSRVEG